MCFVSGEGLKQYWSTIKFLCVCVDAYTDAWTSAQINLHLGLYGKINLIMHDQTAIYPYSMPLYITCQLDIHVSVHHDIIYENDQQDETV